MNHQFLTAMLHLLPHTLNLMGDTIMFSFFKRVQTVLKSNPHTRKAENIAIATVWTGSMFAGYTHQSWVLEKEAEDFISHLPLNEQLAIKNSPEKSDEYKKQFKQELRIKMMSPFD